MSRGKYSTGQPTRLLKTPGVSAAGSGGDLLFFSGGVLIGLTIGSTGQVLQRNPGTTGLVWSSLGGGYIQESTLLVASSTTIGQSTLVRCSAAGSNYSIGLNPSSGYVGRISFACIGSNTVTISAAGENIDGAGTKSLTSGKSTTLVPYGSGWTSV